MISFDAEICTDFEKASSREWLETNGIGGFSSGTISGANTRRYHGLLTAAIHPPLGRVTMLSKFEETLILSGERFELSANCYPNAIYPKGFQYLKNFRLDPFSVWTFEVAGVEVEKRIFMIYGENATVIQYRIKESIAAGSKESETDKKLIALELKPLLSFCDYHALQRENADVSAVFDLSENCISIQPYAALPALRFAHNAQIVNASGVWYRNFEYAVEKERGFGFLEDLFQPFVLNFDLSAPASVIVSTERQNINDVENFEKSEIARRENLIEVAEAKDDFARQLALAADQFIVSRGAGKTIIAGYPWFSDWGRDTMIALNGLTLATNRPEIARQILLEYSEHISQGMIPNRSPDALEEAEYNTVDATLWYFEAIRAYAEKTKDYEFVRAQLYEKLIEIIVWHLRGTRFRIHVDTDGLLYAGEKGTQLTWMDAKIGDAVFTPRIGKPVEIQALWYNALCAMADFAARFGDAEDGAKYKSMAATAKETFNRVFWNDAEQCLYDVVENGNRDASVRPNQIFAVSLPLSIVDDAARARKIVEKVETELLTPVGLRSLSPNDAQYRPIYKGSPYERDSAYHQGTIWAWLAGAFVDAYRKVYRAEPQTERRVAEMLSGLKTHLTETGVGQISEIFDAREPHAPRGCSAQAWSVAEILRVLKN